jgi:SAM-dependent methyltransferase
MSDARVKQKPTYAEMTVDAANPLVRYSHRVRMARSVNTIRRNLSPKGVLVDFGAGTGLLLESVHQIFPDADLIGVEPYMESLYPDSARYVTGLGDLPDCSADVISGFEVCEHLYDHELCDFLEGCRRILRPDGRLVLSVPIMQGMTVALKELNHLRIHGATQYGIGDVCRATFGLSVARPPDPRTTHKGFDFRQLTSKVEDYFRIESRFYSPIAGAPWFMNSQAFLICVPIGPELS